MFIIIGVDGLSSIFLRQQMAHVPHVATLITQSAYSYAARAEVPTLSGINWGTHFFGHSPSYHCWLNNENPSACSGATSIFDVIPTSAGFGKSDMFRRHISAFRTTESDSDTASSVALHVKNRDFDLIAAVFDAVDDANHKSTSQNRALQHVDAYIGQILEHVTPSDYVLLISDHGPRECRWWQWSCRHHYGTLSSEIDTPVILKGPGIVAGQMTRRVTHQDTSYYVLHALNYSEPCDWKLGELSNCTTSWPGTQVHVPLGEEEFRESVDVAIWLVATIIVFFCGIFGCRRGKNEYRSRLP